MPFWLYEAISFLLMPLSKLRWSIFRASSLHPLLNSQIAQCEFSTSGASLMPSICAASSLSSSRTLPSSASSLTCRGSRLGPQIMTPEDGTMPWTVVPFLSARRVEKGRQPAGDLADLPDRPTNRLRRPIQVQDQTSPQTVGRLQPVGPLGDHPRLVVDPLHRRTRLTCIKVVEDLRLPAVVSGEER